MDDMVEERVPVGAHVIRLVRPRSADALIDEDAFGDDEFLPYWAELWPSGHALAEHVAALDLAGARVLELGCGLALPSLTAALAGADVLATDWSEEAVSLVQENARANAVQLRAAVLRWDDPASLMAARFDLVLAADVLYEARNAAPLLDMLGRSVVEGGRAVLADPGRRHAESFLSAADAGGWQVTTRRTPALPRGALYELER